MAEVYRLCVGVLTALALCKCCLAAGNATTESATLEPANGTVDPCHHQGGGDNCTVTTAPTTTEGPWSGHFSKCPGDLEHYCIHGACRFVEEQDTPSCRCEQGFTGSRCEYVELDWQKGEKRHILIACGVGGFALLILVIVVVCCCSRSRRSRLCWRRRRRREEPRNGSEKLTMMDTGAPHAHVLTADTKESPHANAV